jgi:7-cyano-7-deazaguanine tRNA-ribosyltransferase
LKYYVSWYPGDPYYPMYDSDCSLLVSASSVSNEWNIKRFPVLPCNFMVDSGGYRYGTTKIGEYPPKKILKKQLSIISDTGIPSIVCPLDYPILEAGLSSNYKDRNIHQTIAFAYELKNHISQMNLGNNILPMGIIQGDNPDTICHCAYELKAIGFSIYGLGSLANIKNKKMIEGRVLSVIPIVGAENLHLFGMSSIKIAHFLNSIGIRSIDSARAAKAAAYNQILYSNPFRQYGIFEGDNVELKGEIPIARRLAKPLPCCCPVCRIEPDQILGVGKRKNIQMRTLHNYYHLKLEFNKLEQLLFDEH